MQKNMNRIRTGSQVNLKAKSKKKNSLMQQRQPTITNGPRLAIDTQLIMNIARPFCVWLACLLASASPTYLM